MIRSSVACRWTERAFVDPTQLRQVDQLYLSAQKEAREDWVPTESAEVPEYCQGTRGFADRVAAEPLVLQVSEPSAYFLSTGFLKRPQKVGEERVAAE